MSRDITAGFKAEVTGTNVTPVMLVTAFFDSETIRFWNGWQEFDYGGNTYTGAGNLLEVGSIDETQKIEARGVSIQLSGIPSALISIALSENYQDRQVTIDLGFLDADGVMIADPFQFFSGKADVMNITDGSETATIQLTAENNLIALQRINERRRTDADQKLAYPTDDFFSTVTSLQAKAIVWK